jgi:hypothetical protein
LDELDKALSGPIFRMHVPKCVEALIAVPGSMFGVMLPTFIPLLLPGPLDIRYLLMVTLPFNLVGALRVRMWMQDPYNMHLVMVRKLVPYM